MLSAPPIPAVKAARVDLSTQAAGNRAQVLAHRRIEVNQVLRHRPHDQFLHVEVGGVQQPALLGGRQHGNGVGRAGRTQVGALERIDGNVDLVEDPAAIRLLLREADFLADVEHRRLVSLTFANHNGAVDRHRVHFMAHGLDRDLIGPVAIALAHGVRAGDGGLLGDAEEFEGEV